MKTKWTFKYKDELNEMKLSEWLTYDWPLYESFSIETEILIGQITHIQMLSLMFYS